MTGFTMGGFGERHHWRPEAALCKTDWTERPELQVWRDLVKGKWWTRATLTTDEKGAARTPAYFGFYDVTVERGGRTQSATMDHQPGRQVPAINLP